MSLRSRFLGVSILIFLFLIIVWHHVYNINNEYDPKISKVRKAMVHERMIRELRRRNDADLLKKNDRLFYRKRPEAQHVDCGRVMQGDQTYISSLTGDQRVFLVEDPALDMSCPALVRRINLLPDRLRPLKSGIAFSRIVHTDYEFIEKQVHTSYHPQNSFCFAVDRKAPLEFREKIQKLASCFDNIHVLPIVDEFDRAGHNQSLASTKCMRLMLQFPDWNYILLLQNHDVITKSVYEMTRVYELLGGANDVDAQKEAGRAGPEFKWDPKTLRLFRNETGFSDRLLTTPMTLGKGDMQGSVSRAAVEWLMNIVDLTVFLDQWNQCEYGCDEQFLASFQVNAEYGMPGHFTDECIRKGIYSQHVSRMSQWGLAAKQCATKTRRHGMCLLGIEDLRTVAAYPNLMFNKMMPLFDYSIVECTAELLFNRTFLAQDDHPLDEHYYSSMVHVVYHRHHKEPGFRLNCTPSRTPWLEMKYPV